MSCLPLALDITIYKPLWEFRGWWAVTEPIWKRYRKGRWTQCFTDNSKT